MRPGGRLRFVVHRSPIASRWFVLPWHKRSNSNWKFHQNGLPSACQATSAPPQGDRSRLNADGGETCDGPLHPSSGGQQFMQLSLKSSALVLALAVMPSVTFAQGAGGVYVITNSPGGN